MRQVLHMVLASIVCFPLSAVAAPIEVPSGQPVTFFEVIWEAEGEMNTYRFRYIAPQIARDGGSIGFETAEQDIKHLCETSALPALIEQNRPVDRIVISVSDREVMFGKPDPEATQFFEVYSLDGAACIWEGF